MTTYTVEALWKAIVEADDEYRETAVYWTPNEIRKRAIEISAAQPSASDPVACHYMLGGTRFKLSFDRHGNVGVFSNYAEELDGRWVVLVDATDNRHMAAPQPSPQQAGECDCELVAHGKWKNDQEIELCAASDPKALNLYLCDSHRQAGTRKVTDADAFTKWWLASKYCQVVTPRIEWERVALDAWNAALESFAATRVQDYSDN